MQLRQIYGCFYKDFNEVHSYILIGDQKVEKILFNIHRNIF
jgi:hypothetical protein